MNNFSLTSALVGSFITAVFSYIAWIIQKSVLARSERKRVAFFYLVKICEILAIKRAIEFVFKNEITDLKKIIGDDKHGFHMFCAGFSKLLNDNSESVSENKKLLIMNMGNTLKQLYTNKQECFGYKIDDEIVSKFPQSAILKYHFFINYIRQLQTFMEILITSLDKFDFKLFTPESLYGQIEGIKNIYESAESLVVSLSKESGIKKNEVNNIINKQFKEFSTNALKAKYNKKITDIFLESFNKAKLSSTDNTETNS